MCVCAVGLTLVYEGGLEKTNSQKGETKKTKLVFLQPEPEIQLVFWTMSNVAQKTGPGFSLQFRGKIPIGPLGPLFLEK